MSSNYSPFFSDERLESYRVIQTFANINSYILGIDFTPNGEVLASGEEHRILLFNNCRELTSILNSSEQGFNKLCFLNNNHILHTSMRYNNSIMYFNIDEKIWERRFNGHTRSVTSLSVIPSGNIFVTSSLDRTVKIWDIRKPSPCGGTIVAKDAPLTDVSNDGTYLAVAVDKSFGIDIFDVRSLNRVPMKTINCARPFHWKSVRFSPNGQHIVISTYEHIPALIKNYQRTQKIFYCRTNELDSSELSYTPDSQYLLRGFSNGSIGIFNISTEISTSTVYSSLSGPIKHIKFNPRFPMAVTANTTLEVWRPALNYSRDSAYGGDICRPLI